LSETVLFKLEDHLFAVMSKLAIQEVSIGWIELSDKALNGFGTVQFAFELRRRFDVKLRSLSQAADKYFRMLC